MAEEQKDLSVNLRAKSQTGDFILVSFHQIREQRPSSVVVDAASRRRTGVKGDSHARAWRQQRRKQNRRTAEPKLHDWLRYG